jgi:hypothetical protein
MTGGGLESVDNFAIHPESSVVYTISIVKLGLESQTGDTIDEPIPRLLSQGFYSVDGSRRGFHSDA